MRFVDPARLDYQPLFGKMRETAEIEPMIQRDVKQTCAQQNTI